MSTDQNTNPDIEVVKQVYAGINKNDPENTIKLFDSEIFRMEFEGTPSGGTLRGLPAMLQNLSVGRSNWAEGSCTPKSFVNVGKAIIVDVHVLVRLKGSEKWIDGRVTDTFIIRNSKVLEMHSFDSEQKALEWANTTV